MSRRRRGDPDPSVVPYMNYSNRRTRHMLADHSISRGRGVHGWLFGQPEIPRNEVARHLFRTERTKTAETIVDASAVKFLNRATYLTMLPFNINDPTGDFSAMRPLGYTEVAGLYSTAVVTKATVNVKIRFNGVSAVNNWKHGLKIMLLPRLVSGGTAEPTVNDLATSGVTVEQFQLKWRDSRLKPSIVNIEPSNYDNNQWTRYPEASISWSGALANCLDLTANDVFTEQHRNTVANTLEAGGAGVDPGASADVATGTTEVFELLLMFWTGNLRGDGSTVGLGNMMSDTPASIDPLADVSVDIVQDSVLLDRKVSATETDS